MALWWGVIGQGVNQIIVITVIRVNGLREYVWMLI